MSHKIYINARFLTQEITGVQRFAIELSKQLKKQDLNYVFLSPKKNIISDKLAKELDTVFIGNLTGHLWEQIELPLFLKKQKKPLLINFANTAPLNYLNNIVTVHDLAFTKNKKWFSPIFRNFYNFLIPRILKKARHVITVSEFSKTEIQKYVQISSNLITVVYNGTEHLPKSNIHVNKKNYYLAVASLDPRKNLPKVIEAFTKLKLPLKIVGGKSKSFSKIKYKTSSNIQFLGRVSDSDLIDLYAKAKGLIYLPLYEGFGIPPIEAIIQGTRPIVSDLVVFHEVLKSTAIYCNPLDVNDIINTIQTFNNNQQNLHQDEILYIKNRFSWENSSKRIITIINQVS